MKLAIIGAGNLGGSLGSALAKAGHAVVFGVNDSNDSKLSVLKANQNVTFASIKDAISENNLILLATPWGAVPGIVRDFGPWDNKTIVDCTNPVKSDFSGIEFSNSSGAEEIQKIAKGATVAKCFNQTGAKNFSSHDYKGASPFILHASDSAAAKETLSKLIRDIGFEPIDAGGLQSARLLENLAWIWISLAYKQKLGPNFIFSINLK